MKSPTQKIIFTLKQFTFAGSGFGISVSIHLWLFSLLRIQLRKHVITNTKFKTLKLLLISVEANNLHIIGTVLNIKCHKILELNLTTLCLYQLQYMVILCKNKLAAEP